MSICVCNFHHLIPQIVFCGHGDFIADLVVFPIVVFWSVANHCFVHPWSPVFLLHHYSWLCRYKRDSCVGIFLFDWGWLFVCTVWLFSSLSHTTLGLLNLSSRPPDGLLNRILSMLSHPGLTDIVLTCTKDIYISISCKAYFLGSLDKFYAGFFLSITLLIVQW